jgi:hypothetical protein
MDPEQSGKLTLMHLENVPWSTQKSTCLLVQFSCSIIAYQVCSMVRSLVVIRGWRLPK